METAPPPPLPRRRRTLPLLWICVNVVCLMAISGVIRIGPSTLALYLVQHGRLAADSMATPFSRLALTYQNWRLDFLLPLAIGGIFAGLHRQSPFAARCWLLATGLCLAALTLFLLVAFFAAFLSP